MVVSSSTPPTVGLVVWFTATGEHPWPVVVTRKSGNGYLVQLLGKEGPVPTIRMAQTHELTTFECNLHHAIVEDSDLRSELGTACVAACEHAKGIHGTAYQSRRLSSDNFTQFIDTLLSAPPGSPHSFTQIKEDIPDDATVSYRSARMNLRNCENEMLKKFNEATAAARAAEEALLLNLAANCAADATSEHRENMKQLWIRADKASDDCETNRQMALTLLRDIEQHTETTNPKRKQSHVSSVTRKKKRRTSLSPKLSDGKVDEEVLDEGHAESGISDGLLEVTTAGSMDDSHGVSRGGLIEETIIDADGGWKPTEADADSANDDELNFLDENTATEPDKNEDAFAIARPLIGVKMLSERYASPPHRWSRERAFVADLKSWLRENGEELREIRIGGVDTNAFKIFDETIGRGGIKEVMKKKQLTALCAATGHGRKASRIKLYYANYLYRYEQLFVHGMLPARGAIADLKLFSSQALGKSNHKSPKSSRQKGVGTPKPKPKNSVTKRILRTKL